MYLGNFFLGETSPLDAPTGAALMQDYPVNKVLTTAFFQHTVFPLVELSIKKTKKLRWDKEREPTYDSKKKCH